MTTEVTSQTADGNELVAAFRAAAPEYADRKFWITLSFALTLHLLFLVGFLRSPTRQMGDPNTPSDAVAVSFVTEAELRDASTGSEGGPSTPPPAEPAPQQQPPPEPQAQQQPETPPAPPTPPQPPAEAAPAVPPAPAPKAAEIAKEAEPPAAEEPPPLAENTDAIAALPKETKKEEKPPEAKQKTEQKVDATKELEKELPELLELQDPAREARQAQKQQPARKQQQQAMRQPDMGMPNQPQMRMQSLEGREAGIQRPAGITRSGANDDFARGVVRALRQTMPQMNALGRMTVRIIINQNGNIESVEVLSRSENTDLNRAIVFSTKQASFPFPPNGATLLDRTFTITYIYH